MLLRRQGLNSTRLMVDNPLVKIPADDRSYRRIYLRNIFSKFDVEIYRCADLRESYPYGYVVQMFDRKNGIGFIEIGPIPKEAKGRKFNIIVADVTNGCGYEVPVFCV